MKTRDWIAVGAFVAVVLLIWRSRSAAVEARAVVETAITAAVERPSRNIAATVGRTADFSAVDLSRAYAGGSAVGPGMDFGQGNLT